MRRQDPGLRVHLEEFLGGESGMCGVPARTLRNCAGDRGLGMIGDLLEGAREIHLLLDWTGIGYYGKYAEGLGIRR